MAVADQPWQPDRSAVDQRHAPPPAVDAEDRVGRGHPQVAPERELETAGDGEAFDGGDDRLRQQHPRRPHRTIDRHVGVDVVPAAGADRLEIGAGAERATGPGQHGDGKVVVGLEGSERRCQRGGGRAVDGVADVGPVDRDDRDGAIAPLRHGPRRACLHRPSSIGPVSIGPAFILDLHRDAVAAG